MQHISTRKAIILFFTAFAAMCIYALYLYPNGPLAQQAAVSIKNKLPDYFVPSNNIALSDLSGVNPKNLRLEKNESLGQGIYYVADVGLDKAPSYYFTQSKDKGWMAIFGTQSPSQKIIKLRKDNQIMFLIFDSVDNSHTKISLVPVNVH